MKTKYTEEQREAMRKYYPDANHEELFKWFPGKTKEQISYIAHYMGVKSNNPGYRKDLTGRQFGQLTVMCFDHVDKDNRYTVYWKCICSCGKECVVSSNALKTGGTKSCGCLRRDQTSKIKREKDHTGERFGKLTATERLAYYKDGKTYYRCICDCGNEIIVNNSNLISGQTKSCGCLKRTHFQTRKGRQKPHGKPVNQYDLEGHYLRTFETAAEAKRVTGATGISFVVNQISGCQVSGGYQWRFETGNHEDIPPVHTKGKPVLQFDAKTHQQISSYWSVTEAEKATGVSRAEIYRCCKGDLFTAGGYIWRYK